MNWIDRKRIITVIALLSCLMSFKKTYATHAAGADISYQWVSGRTYKVTVSFYRDCGGIAAPNSMTLDAKSSSCGISQSYILNKSAGTGTEITFPCRFIQTVCSNSGSTYSGYQLYEYTNNITLPQNCTDWVLSFYVANRNCAISTLVNPCNDNLYIEATLDNVNAPINNSPKFTNNPVAFLCVNQTSYYNHGVIDPDGDSLVYSFVTPKKYDVATSTVGTVTFSPGFSATSPLTSSPGASINANNGDIIVNPTVNNEVGVTAVLIKEYRNGILIGSVTRDMQFITMICNPNILPTASGINGSSLFSITACPGFPISFFINSNDLNPADSVFMTSNNTISGATFTSTNAAHPVGTFSWTPSAGQARSQPYNFTVSVRDNSCAYNGTQTYGFQVYVPVITASISSPAFNGFNVACNGGSSGSATASGSGGTLPYTYSWNPSGQSTKTAINLGANTYTVTISDGNGCTKQASVTLSQPPSAVSLSVTASSNVSCNGGNDGVATITPAGGVGTYTYLWTPSGQTTATAASLQAISYTAKVTDQNGCTAQQNINISQPAVLNPTVSSFQNVSCHGNSNGSISIGVSGGTSPYTHNWTNGATTAIITGLSPGTYRDTVRDSKGCMQVISQIITEPGAVVSLPSSSIATNNVSCFGLSDGSANVNPSGGTAPYTIIWSNGDAGNTADSLPAGNYNLQISDLNGCTVNSIVTITQPALLNSTFTNISIAPSGHNIKCKGDLTGKVKESPNGGTTPYSYSWSTGASIDSIVNVASGVYTVTVTDNHGCTTVDNVTLTEPGIMGDSLRIKDVGCKGEPSGGIKAIAYGGVPPYDFVWNNGFLNTDTIGNLYAGFYQVVIADINNCQVTDTVTIQEPDSIVPLISPSSFIGFVNISCNGAADGSATANAIGGTRPFTYTWSQGSIDSFAVNLSAGLVTVHIEDINGCSINRDTILSEPMPFSYSNTINNPSCYGDSSGSIILNTSGSVGPYSYSWSTGASNDTLSTLQEGVYSVIVEDANNCYDTLTFTLNNPDSMTTNVSVSNYQGYNVRCNGGNDGWIALHVSGGDGNYLYSWNTSSNADSISNLSGTSYNVSIIDGRGCQKDTLFTLNEPSFIFPIVTPDVFSGGSNVSCNGYFDGTARSIVSGGVAPYDYLWSNGDIADSAVGLGAGNFTLAVTDSNGCVVVVPFTLSEPGIMNANPALSSYNGFNTRCYGDSTGCVTLNIVGGSGPYDYTWHVQDSINSPTMCNFPAGTFSVSIVDANGCRLDTSITVSGPQPLGSNTVLSSYNGYEIQCNGMSNGNIDVVTVGGAAPFTYFWSTSDTTEDISNLAAGSYQVTITDANSCGAALNFTLNEPPPINFNLSMTGSSCSQNNGSAQAVLTSGLAPVTYLWTPSGQTTSTAANLSSGLYNVSVTDSVGCSSSDSINVVSIPVIGVSFWAQVNNNCPGYSNGSAVAITSGGVPPFSYIWSNGDQSALADSLHAGYSLVMVTDASGCIETDSVLITDPQAFSALYNVTNAFCSGVNNGTAEILLSGGTPPYQFTWNNGDAGAIADNLGGGYAVVNYIDQNGCNGKDSVNIIQLPALSSTISNSKNVSCFGDQDGQVTVTPVVGGAPPYVYSWSNGDVGLSAWNLSAGVVTLTITDVYNCNLVLPVTISSPAILAAAANVSPVSCDGQKDGKSEIIVTGGTRSYTYQWEPLVSTDSVATDLAEGTYSVTVTDVNNCTVSASSIIKINYCDIDLPTGYSPNGDGKNDSYIIHGLSRYNENKLSVFNRWGNLVYEFENYTNNEWHGQNNNGDDLPEATYYVVFYVKDIDKSWNSFIDLRR